MTNPEETFTVRFFLPDPERPPLAKEVKILTQKQIDALRGEGYEVEVMWSSSDVERVRQREEEARSPRLKAFMAWLEGMPELPDINEIDDPRPIITVSEKLWNFFALGRKG